MSKCRKSEKSCEAGNEEVAVEVLKPTLERRGKRARKRGGEREKKGWKGFNRKRKELCMEGERHEWSSLKLGNWRCSKIV